MVEVGGSHKLGNVDFCRRSIVNLTSGSHFVLYWEPGESLTPLTLPPPPPT